MHSSISVSDSCNSDTSNSDEQGYNTGYSIDYDFGFCMSLPSQQLHRRCQFCRCAHCSGSRPHQGVSLCFSLQPHGNPRWVSQWLGLSSSGMSPCFRNPRQAPPQPSHPCGALSPNPRWVSLWLGLPGGGTIPSFRDPRWATRRPSHPCSGPIPDPTCTRDFLLKPRHSPLTAGLESWANNYFKEQKACTTAATPCQSVSAIPSYSLNKGTKATVE